MPWLKFMSVRRKTIFIISLLLVLLLAVLLAASQIMLTPGFSINYIQNKGRYLLLRIVTFSAVLLLGGGLIYFIEKNLLRRLKELTDYLSKNIAADNVKLMNVNGDDEFAHLYHLINELFATLEIYEDHFMAQKERLDVTLHSIGDGVIATDISGKIVLFNQAAEKLTGRTLEEALGKPLGEIFHTTTDPGKDFTDKLVLIAKDGQERNIELNSAPIRDRNNEIIGAVLVFQDITAKLKFEEEFIKNQKLESIGMLAGGIAHDFNNILSGFLGNIQLAKIAAKRGKDVSGYLEVMEKSISRATLLTKQLLTFSKGGGPVKETAALGPLVQKILENHSQTPNIFFEVNFPDTLWPVEIDREQIQQAIENIICNAEQAMPKGGLIQIAAENIEAGELQIQQLTPGRYIRLSITDHGLGIPVENQARVFDPFFSTKPKKNGLGLTTVYSIVKRHEGYVTFESSEKSGTTFYVYLPVPSKNSASKEIKGKGAIPGTGKILVMDDEEVIRDVMRELLTELGYQVECVKCGSEAIESYLRAWSNHEPFDLVIMDLIIPGEMGGEEAIRELLKIDPKVKSIICSGYSNDPVIANYQKYGFSGFTTKPFTIETLSQMIAGLLKKEQSKT
ncbi:MAG: response regulator [Firmicutes bacterium]|nr:response regulator [Bacillota bacterium]